MWLGLSSITIITEDWKQLSNVFILYFILQDVQLVVLECKFASWDRRIQVSIVTGQLFTLTVYRVFFKGIYLCSLLLRVRSTNLMVEVLQFGFPFMRGKILTLVVRTTQCAHYVQSAPFTLPLCYLQVYYTLFYLIPTLYYYSLDYKKYSSWIIFLNELRSVNHVYICDFCRSTQCNFTALSSIKSQVASKLPRWNFAEITGGFIVATQGPVA